MEEYGSFDWYESMKDQFLSYLVRAIHHADQFNLRRLRQVFPHIIMAHDEHDWSKAPKTELEIVMNDTLANPEKKESTESANGSFNWYLYRSGHFVTFMANAILYADAVNLEILRPAYPQMASAFELDNWDICPSGFSLATYNGTPTG